MSIKIDRNNIEDILPLTPMQEGLLFHYILHSNNNNNNNKEYFEQLSVDLNGHVDDKIFRNAWQNVADNNEMLRTVFAWGKLDKNVQLILKNNLIEIYNYDVSSSQDKEIALKEIKNTDKEKGFDLRNVPFRITLCKKESNQYVMILSNHHIILDGWSTTIILKEFFQSYSELIKNDFCKKKYKTKFKDVIRAIVKKDDEEEFWKSYFNSFERQDKLKLNYKKNRKIGTKETYIFTLTKNKKEINMVLKDKKNISTASLLLGAWGILMQKYLDTNDVNFGTILSGREIFVDGIDDMVGLFINTLPLRMQSSDGDSIEKFLEVANHRLNSIKNYQASKLVDINQYVGCSELFDTIVAIENYPLNIEALGNDYLKATNYYIDGRTNYDLTAGIQLFEEEISVNIGYNNGVFSRVDIEKLSSHYNNIVNFVVENLEKKISEIDMLDEEEKNEILYEINNTKVVYEKFVPIYKMFEEQVIKYPNRTAIVFEERHLTYKELNDKSNQLAFYLRQNGIGAEKIVVLVLERSIESIIAIWGVLKAGGAFIPVDIDTPLERKRFIIKDSNAAMIITYKNRRNEFDFTRTIIGIDDENSWCNKNEEIIENSKEDDLAYVIYTSGTTGNPKGVMIEHKSLANIANSWNKNYRLKNFKVNLLQLANFSFDVFIGDICKTFLNGGKMVICPKNTRIDLEALYELIDKEEVTMFDSNPALICNLMDYIHDNNLRFDNLKLIILGADACPVEDFKRTYERFGDKIRILNGYGITEATVESTYYEVDNKIGIPYYNLPIGKSMCNTRHYVLGYDLHLLPKGVVGELYIAGECLARKYLNNEDLTNEKFMLDPFFPGERMYKTGDMARLLHDGNIEFLGRKDNQIKIRGFRIETGEIESVLLQHGEVKEVVVIDLEENNRKFMCAYYVAQKELEKKDLRNHLLRQLPEYMVPQNFIKLDKIPLTHNGKVDKRALKNMEYKIVNEIVSPRTEMEEKLSCIWNEVLKKDNISVKANFFEIGGNSLNATSLMAKTSKRLEINIPLMEIYNYPTIEDMAKFIQKSSKSKYVKINKVEEREDYPMSSAQKRVFILQEIDKRMVAYNMSTVLKIEGAVNKGKLEQTFEIIVKRHDAFRTSFKMEGEDSVQRIHEHVDFSVKYKEIESGFNIETEIEDFIQPFNLEIAPLIRVGLIKIKEDEHLLIVDMHHIIADGVSVSIIIDEFTKLYDGLTLKKSEYKYKDYAVWQQKQLNNIKDKKDYWKTNLSGQLPLLNLPTDYQRPPIQSFQGDTLEFYIGKDLASGLNRLASENNATLFMVILSAFVVTLHKYTTQEDIIVGTPIAGRRFSEFENIVGMFVNLLAIRSYPSDKKTFRKFLCEVKEISLKAYENQDYQFEDLIELLWQKRDVSRNPIFDVVFAMQNIEEKEVNLKDVKVSRININQQVSKFDFSLCAIEENDRICFNIDYCTKLFRKETIEKFYNHFINLLEAICLNVDVEISKIQISGHDEIKKLITDFNNTKKDYLENYTIQDLFEMQVAKTPNNVAVILEDEELTYEELNNSANRLARVLREKGIGVDDIVGVMTSRGKEMIIAILAVLKAGGAYLPIDTDIPDERLEFIIRDSKLKLILNDNEYINSYKNDIETLNLRYNNFYLKDNANLDKINNKNSLVYAIYTSGTTGNPKGVMIQHKNLVNYIDFSLNQYFRNEDHVVPIYTSIAFDLTVTSLFSPLLHGDKIIIYRDNDIGRVMSENVATLIKVTPSHLELIKDFDNSKSKVKVLIVGGEELKAKLAQDVYNSFNGKIEIYNEYGPTETTVGCTVHKYSNKIYTRGNVCIGKPIQNNQIYILDKCEELCPLGVVGELCVGGIGVGKGYLNNDSLTNKKFIDNPFIKDEKIYKTGDLAKWNEDGNIEFLGRIDNQVKMRGFRIELSEIENVLLKVKGIHKAIALVIQIDDEKLLCAYYVGEVCDIAYIKKYLSKYLPEYMIPMHFIKLDKIPLNQNGKVNKIELPMPEYVGANYIAARNDLEESIQKIFVDVLKLEKVGVNDNFFDLGGHSLKAMNLVNHLKKHMNYVITIMDIFENPTIEKLAIMINSKKVENECCIEKSDQREYYPLSPAQKRVYLMQKLDEQSVAYNISTILMIQGKIDVYKIEKSFNELIKRHKVFSTSFKNIDGELVQKIEEKVQFTLDYMEISDEQLIDKEVKSFSKPFELSKSPLLRAALIKQNKDKYILMVDMHHIISDGTSVDIIVDEFSKIYNDEKLEDVKLQYKDYVLWQQQKNEIAFKKMELYWKDVLKGELPVLKLPVDFERPQIQSFEGDMMQFEILQDLAASIKAFAKSNNSTLFMVLLASFKTLLYKYSEQNDIIVGTAVAGRNHVDIERTIGMFINLLAMRSYPKDNLTFKEYVENIRQVTLKAYENQDYQFEDLLDILNYKRDVSMNPIFNTAFILQNMDIRALEIGDAKISQYRNVNKDSKFDLCFLASENEGKILISIEYSTKLFMKETIARMFEHYKSILEQVTKDEKILIKLIKLITEEEKQNFILNYNANNTFTDENVKNFNF